ncbi:MAG: hypothetical protein EAZ70_13525, partial [Runella slithyformis]
MKKLNLILFTFFIAIGSYAQQVPNVKNSWLGNSNPFPTNFVPQGIEGMCVGKDGTVYTNVPWEEGGGNFGEFKPNGDVNHGEASFGWGLGGGSDAASNSTYVYYCVAVDNEGGGLQNEPGYVRWPVGATTKWLGISRRLKSDVKQGAPFEGGASWPVGTTLVALEYNSTVEQPWIQGIYANETELYVGIDSRNIVKVYNANTMAFIRQFSVANPRQIAMDSQGNIWVAQGMDATKIKRYTPTGTLLPQSITLPAGSFVGDFCIDKNDRILIGDVGRREQVLIYTNILVNPDFTSTFGALNGIHSGISGRNEPLKFQQIRGIGVDTLGNIFIGNTQWHTGGQGTMIEKYNLTTGVMEWKRHCTMFVDAMGIDNESDGRDVYGKVEHFTVDHSLPPGQDNVYASYTIDRYKYPADPRLWEQFASVQVKTIKGHKFLAMSSMNGGLGAIFRFKPDTDGDIAIPCIVFGININPRYPNSINGPWMWRDLNGNGQMDAGEYTKQVQYDIDGGYGASFDDNGDIWQAGVGNILHTKCLGLDANNILLYNGNYTLIPAPAPFTNVKRAYYDVKLNRMYLAGGTTTQDTVDSWQSMGRAINRYDNWSTGNRTASTSELVLPAVTVGGFTVPISFRVVKDYIFVGFLGGDNTIPRLQLNIYKVLDNSMVGYIRVPWGGAGLFDIIQSFDGYQRKNGSYMIVTEEDGRNKNVMYNWSPTVPAVETSNTLDANTNYLGYLNTAASKPLNVTSNVSWTITGAPAWLTLSTTSGTGNAVVNFNVAANTAPTSRTATLTLSGGTLSKTITVFQNFADVTAPSNATALAATLLTPFSFTLNWAASTDNVLVTGYQIFKDGNLVATTPSINTSFIGLTPNTAYTMLVKSIDAAGNISAGTTLIVTTPAITYPYITARGHANFEAPPRAFDGINWSSWMDWESTTWLQIQYATPVVYNTYSIYCIDDSLRGRDPKNWVLQGSNDGINYTNLNTQNNQSWTTQGSVKTYYANNTTAYSHYRFNFFGGSGTQLGEIIFANGTVVDTQSPTVPLALTASGITQNSVNLEWDASTDNVAVTTYEVFKNGVLIGTPTTNSLAVSALTCNSTYTFTVKAKDRLGNTSAASVGLILNTASCNPCATLLPLASPIDDYSSGTVIKQANASTGKITATNKITNTANVTYQAGKSIVLEPGFKAN